MSIINEALKKTEAHLQKSTQNSSLPTKHFGPKPFLLYILILLAGLFLGNFIFTLLKHKTQGSNAVDSRTPPVKQNQNPELKTQPQVPHLPALIIPPKPPVEENNHPENSFVLNGIFFSENDSYALINNQIVRENDYVDAAKVSLITTNSVQLENAGQIIKLTTMR